MEVSIRNRISFYKNFYNKWQSIINIIFFCKVNLHKANKIGGVYKTKILCTTQNSLFLFNNHTKYVTDTDTNFCFM